MNNSSFYSLSLFSLNQERTLRTRQEHDYEQMIRSLQKKLTDSTQCHNRTIEELKHDLQQERLINQKYNGIRQTSVPDFASVILKDFIEANFLFFFSLEWSFNERTQI